MSAAGDKGALLRQMRAQRMRWVELDPADPGVEGATPPPPGKRVRIIRPTEVEIGRHLTRGDSSLAVAFEDVVRFTTDWDGFTEADLLGAGLGASDALAFDSDLWAELVANRSHWLKRVGQALLDAVVAHIAAQEQARKN